MKKGSEPHYLFVNTEVVSQILAENGFPAEHPQHAFYKNYILDQMKGTFFTSSEEMEQSILNYMPKVASLSFRKEMLRFGQEKEPDFPEPQITKQELIRLYKQEVKGIYDEELMDEIISGFIVTLEGIIVWDKYALSHPELDLGEPTEEMRDSKKMILILEQAKTLQQKMIAIDRVINMVHEIGYFVRYLVIDGDTMFLNELGDIESIASLNMRKIFKFGQEEPTLPEPQVTKQELKRLYIQNAKGIYDEEAIDAVVSEFIRVLEGCIEWNDWLISSNTGRKENIEVAKEQTKEEKVLVQVLQRAKTPQEKMIAIDQVINTAHKSGIYGGSLIEGVEFIGVDPFFDELGNLKISSLSMKKTAQPETPQENFYEPGKSDEYPKGPKKPKRRFPFYNYPPDDQGNIINADPNYSNPMEYDTLPGAPPQGPGIFGNLDMRKKADKAEERGISYILDALERRKFELADPIDIEYFVYAIASYPPGFSISPNIHAVNSLILNNMEKFPRSFIENWKIYFAEEYGLKESFSKELATQILGEVLGEYYKGEVREEPKPLTEQEEIPKWKPFPEFIKKRPELTEETMEASPYADLLRKYTADEIFDIASGRKDATEEEVEQAKEVITRGIVSNRLSMRKKAQIDKQMFFDFYGVSLLSDQYLEANPYAKQYKDTVVQEVKDVYVPLITKMCYSELSKHVKEVIGGWRKLKKELGFDFRNKEIKDLTLEQVAIIYNEGKWYPRYGGKPWGYITKSLIQLKNTTNTNQLITIIDHINDIQHNTGLMFHDFPEVEKWFSDALDVKAQSTPEGLIPYLSTDLQKLVTEDLKLRGQEVVAPERYISMVEKFEQAENPNTLPETLAELAKYEEFRWEVAGNPSTPPATLAELVKTEDEWTRWRIADNPNTSPETLAELAKDEDRKVRYRIADNPNTSSETLAELAKDEDRKVRQVVMDNPNTSPEIKEQLKRQLMQIYSNFNLNMKKKGKGLKEYIRENIEEQFIIPQQLKLRFGKVAQAEFNVGDKIIFDTTRYLGRGKKRVGGVLKGKGVITKKEDDTYSIKIMELTEVEEELKNIFRTGMTAEFALDEIKLEKIVEPKKEIPVEKPKPREKIPTFELEKEPSELRFELEEEEIPTYELVEGTEKPIEKTEEEEKEEKPFWKGVVEKAWESFKRPVTKPFGSKLYMKKTAIITPNMLRNLYELELQYRKGNFNIENQLDKLSEQIIKELIDFLTSFLRLEEATKDSIGLRLGEAEVIKQMEMSKQELENAFDINSKMIAIDNTINIMHLNYDLLQHLYFAHDAQLDLQSEEGLSNAEYYDLMDEWGSLRDFLKEQGKISVNLNIRKTASVDEHEYRWKEIHQGKIPKYIFKGFQEGLKGEKYILVDCNICESTLMLTPKEVKAYEYKIEGLPRGWEQEVKLSAKKYKGPIKSILEDIAQDVWTATDLETVKNVIISKVENSKIDEDDKQKIIETTNKTNTLLELQKYIANSILFYEGMGTKLSMRKKAQIDEQMFFDFYGVSLLSDQYLEANPYAKQYKDMIVNETKDVYVPLITDMVYSELKKHTKEVLRWGEWKEKFNIKRVKDLSLEQLKQIYNEGDWAAAYGGEAWGSIVASLIQLINTTNTNQLITIIDHINDIQHNTGLMFHDFPKVEEWFFDALDIKAQSTLEGLIPYLSSDIKKLVIEDLKLKGQEVVAPERYISSVEKIELAESPNTSPETLAELAKNENESVREAVAGNPNTPPETLAELAKDENKWIYPYVAANLNTLPETLAELAKDENMNVHYEVAANPNTPSEALAELAKDKDEEVLWEVVTNPNTPPKIKNQLEKRLSSNLNMRKKAVSDSRVIDRVISYFKVNDLPKTYESVYAFILEHYRELSTWEIERLTEKIVNTARKQSVRKKAEVVVEGSPPGEGSWAMYQGNVYVTYDKNKRHAVWFEELGLPSVGTEYDNIVRGYFMDDRSYIGWYGTGDYNEFYNHLGELKTALGYPEDSEVGMIDYTTQEFQVLSMRKKAQVVTKQELIRLYKQEAKGIYDEELMDEIISGFIVVLMRLSEEFDLDLEKSEQLENMLSILETASAPEDKMMVIDQVINEVHYSGRYIEDLIEKGNKEFLDELSNLKISSLNMRKATVPVPLRMSLDYPHSWPQKKKKKEEDEEKVLKTAQDKVTPQELLRFYKLEEQGLLTDEFVDDFITKLIYGMREIKQKASEMEISTDYPSHIKADWIDVMDVESIRLERALTQDLNSKIIVVDCVLGELHMQRLPSILEGDPSEVYDALDYIFTQQGTLQMRKDVKKQASNVSVPTPSDSLHEQQGEQNSWHTYFQGKDRWISREPDQGFDVDFPNKERIKRSPWPFDDTTPTSPMMASLSMRKTAQVSLETLKQFYTDMETEQYNEKRLQYILDEWSKVIEKDKFEGSFRDDILGILGGPGESNYQLSMKIDQVIDILHGLYDDFLDYRYDFVLGDKEEINIWFDSPEESRGKEASILSMRKTAVITPDMLHNFYELELQYRKEQDLLIEKQLDNLSEQIVKDLLILLDELLDIHPKGAKEQPEVEENLRARKQELENAFDINSKIIAIDNTINTMHYDWPMIKHLRFQHETEVEKELATDLKKSPLDRIVLGESWNNLITFLKEQGKITQEASILDYPQKHLDSAMWDLSGDLPKLKENVKGLIVERFLNYLREEGKLNNPELWCIGFYYTGSTATYRYRPTTDIDIHVKVDWEKFKKSNPDKAKDDVEEMHKELLQMFWNTLNKEVLPNTQHPLTYYVLSERENVFEMGEEAYDILNDSWIVPPHKLPENLDIDKKIELLGVQANTIMERLDEELGKTKRDFIDYKILKELLDSYEGDKKDIQKLIEKKLDDVESRLKGLQEENVKIHDERQKAFHDGQEPIEEGLSQNWAPGNIVFKLIEKYRYMDVLRKIKHIIEDDKITEDEEKQLENILEPKLSMRKKAQIDEQMFFDFYGLSLLSNDYLEQNPYAKEYKDMIVLQVKDAYVPLITKMIYKDLSKSTTTLYNWKYYQEKFDIENREELTLEQILEISEDDLYPTQGGVIWDDLIKSVLQLQNTTDTNQLIIIIDHINNLEHFGGKIFDYLPETKKWFSSASKIKTEASPEQLLPYFSSDIREFVTENLRLETESYRLNMKKIAISDMEVPENWMVQDKTDKKLRRTNPPRHDKNDSIVEHNIDPRIDMASLNMRKKAYTLKALFEGIEFTDRYNALGILPPNPETMCEGQCEGTGWIPIYKNDMEEPFHTLWLGAEKESPTDDGYHFVKCPDCHGTGLRTNSKIAFIKIKPSKKGLRKLIQMKKKGFEGQPTNKNYYSPSLLLREDQGPSYPSSPAQAEIPGTADDDTWGESNKLKKYKPTKEKIFPDFGIPYGAPGGEVKQF